MTTTKALKIGTVIYAGAKKATVAGKPTVGPTGTVTYPVKYAGGKLGTTTFLTAAKAAAAVV